ncbi:Alpha/Beta hydrolase protein [Scheffersomyces xylosifermentans]|uniref:Alpha/Beta hydrolase protein n=1 Tax=Scheffersomyces xylosifermentans TaxID=1304137 RepID=UPI00315C53EC
MNSSSSFNFDLNNLLNSVNSNVASLVRRKKSTAVSSNPTTKVSIATTSLEGPATSAARDLVEESVVHQYKRSTHPTSVPLHRLFSNSFPLSIKDSLDDYSYRRNPLKFQRDLLSLLPFYPRPDALGRSAQVIQTPIDADGNYINEFVIYPAGKTEADTATMNHLIMVHGYGGGLGFFLKNFEALSAVDNWCVHAIDLLGYGCSSRPPFKLESEDIDSVDKWFHNSYEKWLKKRNLYTLPSSQILVMAHSMGAYLMGTYGIKKNPNFCDKLLMVSPGAIIKHRTPVSVPAYFTKLWEQNISPFTLVRKAGPLGSKVVSGWSSRRFAKLDRNEADKLHKYAYGIFNSPGSGEYMLNYLLAPGADARHPLIERGIHKLECKLEWWYGKEDWMDVKGGQLCSNIINNYHHDPSRSTIVEVEDSGHHIYLDNIEKFNELLTNEMKEMSERQEKKREMSK